MKTIAWILLFALLPLQSFAESKTLFLKSQLKDDVASEEAVLFVQCLTGDGEYSWEMSEGEKQRLPELSLTQKSETTIALSLLTAKTEVHKVIPIGTLLGECEETRKALSSEGKSDEKSEEKKTIDLAPPIPAPSSVALPTDEDLEEAKKPAKWPWIVGGALAVAGAVLLWKSTHRAEFTQIQNGAQ